MNSTRGLVLCAMLALFGAAHASAGVGVSAPFMESVCVDPGSVVAALDDPNFIYNNVPLKGCIALCRKAASDCREMVRLAASCERNSISNNAPYDVVTCELQNPTDMVARRECRVVKSLSRGADQNDIRSGRDAALNACESWLTTCVSTCGIE